MIVTKIEAVTKTKYKVYVDGQFAFVLYKGELSRFHIAEEQELSQELYERIRKEIILKRAKLRAMHLLEDMGRTEAQLREKLSRSDYPADIIEEAMNYVKSFGYVDDSNYAKNFIETRKGQKSRREIYMKLVSKGVARELIDAAFEECYEREDSTGAIIRLLEKKHYDPEDSQPEEKRKIMAYLVRKGFSYEDVRRAMNDYGGITDHFDSNY